MLICCTCISCNEYVTSLSPSRPPRMHQSLKSVLCPVSVILWWIFSRTLLTWSPHDQSWVGTHSGFRSSAGERRDWQNGRRGEGRAMEKWRQSRVQGTRTHSSRYHHSVMVGTYIFDSLSSSSGILQDAAAIRYMARTLHSYTLT